MRMASKRRVRFRDRGEEILDDLYADRNAELLAACKQIMKGASYGLAIHEDLVAVEDKARNAQLNVRHKDFLNIHSLLWLMEFELATLLVDYIKSKGERRWLYARLLFLVLLENSRTLQRVLSKGLRRAVHERLGGDSDRRASELHRHIHAVFEGLNANYKNVRIGVVAHRSDDAAHRSRMLGILSPLDIKDLAWDVLCWCASVHVLMEEYLKTFPPPSQAS